MSNTDNNSMSNCANCGKGEEENDGLKACTACKMVKYCNRDCQIAHRSQHKKECRKRAKEIHDETLFKPPPKLDCPICFIRLPSKQSGTIYKSCCGKKICCGCLHASAKAVGHLSLCPFCRAPAPTREESLKREKKRVEVGDSQAIHNLACSYDDGSRGFPRDQAKAVNLWKQAGERGCASSFFNVARAYRLGEGVARDVKKERHYYELAAMAGHIGARHDLGVLEEESGNIDRAIKHFLISASFGDIDSLNAIREMFRVGYVAKDVYEKALTSRQAYLDEIRNDDRDNAAAVDRNYIYYEE